MKNEQGAKIKKYKKYKIAISKKTQSGLEKENISYTIIICE